MQKFFVGCFVLLALVSGTARGQETNRVTSDFVRMLSVALKETETNMFLVREVSNGQGGCGSMKDGVAVRFFTKGSDYVVFINCYEYGVRINSGPRRYVDENADGKIELVAEGPPGSIPKAIYANELYFPQINTESGPVFQKEFENILLTLWDIVVQDV